MLLDTLYARWMLIWTREINADEIDAWIEALRSEDDWGIELEAVARTTLLAMAASNDTYTGKDLYRVFHSPDQRAQFVATERDEMTVSGRSVDELSKVDETTYSMLANRTLSCHRTD